MGPVLSRPLFGCRVPLLCACLCILGCSTVSPPAAQRHPDSVEAQALHDQAVVRLDRYVDHFRRTSDLQALQPELALAEAELMKSIELNRLQAANVAVARSLVKLGDFCRYRNDWDRAISTYIEATQLALGAGAADVESKALMGHAKALMIGKGAAAEGTPLIERAIHLATGLPDRSYLFDAWQLLANAQEAHGDLVASADSLNRAFAAVVDRVGEDKLVFYGYLDRAGVYQKMAEKCDYQTDFAACLAALAVSRRDYQAAHAAARRLGWAGFVKQSEEFLGRLELREQMIRSQQRVHGGMQEVFAPRQASDVLVNEKFTVGGIVAPELFAWVEAQGGLPVAADARGAYIRGLFSEMNGEADPALDWYLRATQLLEEDRSLLRDERTRGTFLEDKVEFYYSAMLHLLERGRYEEAFNLMERSRSRAFQDLMATRDLALSSPAERKIYATLLELRSRIDRYQSCLFEVRSWQKAGPACRALADSGWAVGASSRGLIPVAKDEPAPDVAPLEADLNQLRQEYDQARQQMSTRAPRLTQLVKSEPVALPELQRQLGRDGSELIAYLSLATQVVIWHIGPTDVQVVSVFLPRAELARKVAALRSSLLGKAAPFNTAMAEELFLFLIAPIARFIESDRVVVIPHEDLHYLPLQVLRDAAAGSFLGDRLKLSYAPSATVLASLAPPAALSRPRAVAFADPSLVHARLETQDVATRYSGQAVNDVLPRESAVKSAVAEAGLVHLAVHGQFLADEPLLSHLALAPGDGEDGRLTAAEMYGLPLQACQLVVLSACETGITRATHANEVIGMLRGLLFSGANAVLLSSWQIDDAATAEWMKAFYSEAATQPLAEAAWAASSSLRNNPSRAHPYYWAPFVLTSR